MKLSKEENDFLSQLNYMQFVSGLLVVLLIRLIYKMVDFLNKFNGGDINE